MVTQPDRPRGRGQKVTDAPVKALARAARPAGAPARRACATRTSRTTLRAWQPDLGVVAAYGKLIPDELLALPRLGMINVHASLLPKYRGAAPVHRAVIDGETETGVTIMRVVEALDAGAMLAKVTRPIGPDETSDVVERDLAGLGARLLARRRRRRSRPAPLTRSRRTTRSSTYAPRLTKDEGLIDWTLPARRHPQPRPRAVSVAARVHAISTASASSC